MGFSSVFWLNDGENAQCRKRQKLVNFCTFNFKVVQSQKPTEIKIRSVNEYASITCTMALLSDNSRPKKLAKANDGDTSDMELSLAEFEAFSLDLNDDWDPMAILLATKAEVSLEKQKKARLSIRNHTSKKAKIPHDTFSYINIARCRRLFSLACYDDLT